MQFSTINHNRKPKGEEIANYLGLTVEVITRMDACSLIRYRDRQFVVNTEDLQHCEIPQLAASTAA